MIKANELRLGNWLQETDLKGKIIYVQVNLDYLEAIEMDDHMFEPIPLTPGILEKCGFDLVNGVYWTRHSITLEHMENLGPNCFDVTVGIAIYSIDVTVEHFHGLQNLYFALTGHELEIRAFTDSGTAASGVQKN